METTMIEVSVEDRKEYRRLRMEAGLISPKFFPLLLGAYKSAMERELKRQARRSALRA